MQVASRIWIVWGIMFAAPAQISSRGITILPLGSYSVELNLVSLLLAWSITEIVRYSFFAFKARIYMQANNCTSAERHKTWSLVL